MVELPILAFATVKVSPTAYPFPPVCIVASTGLTSKLPATNAGRVFAADVAKSAAAILPL